MKPSATGEAVCKVCGCSDFFACPGGCYWAEVDRAAGTGVCSSCVGKKARTSGAKGREKASSLARGKRRRK